MCAGISIEISVETVRGVRIAQRAGADRIELCAGLADGGLTPSAALIEQAVAATTSTEVHVLIRPRPGDFRYSADEIAVIRKDISLARQLGADGVVVGALDAAGRLDVGFIDAFGDIQTTLHRAIDVSADSLQALDEAISLGFTRVLTSGRKRSVLDGAPLIKEMVQRAEERIQVMACGGVRASNALQVVESTGVRDLHAAVRTPVGDVGDGDVSFAGVGVPDGFDRFETDADGVAALCSVIRG
ncbi:copper homeostasis protein [Kibdelosporangium banguiense]|uniref:PF03932 family protein CutC n=1 Tax=Kibdelosporangium banguiense TaxID=1365924 RepID=A0ABS4TAB0_9PSEU|nr:copper homeostasis protein CutC [Kibdelosporangium banguiense]MBP2321360.1 copper homeostasis protein [Kibdelosporangium banguiense]